MSTKNVTLAIDEDVLAKARELAERRGTTLNAMIRRYLVEDMNQEDRVAWAHRGLRELMERSTLDMGPDFHWSREEIYAEREDRMLSRHKHPDLRSAGKNPR